MSVADRLRVQPGPAPGRFAARLESVRVGRDTSSSGRVLSVDALRGFDMFFIMGGVDILRAVDYAVQTPFTQAMSRQLDHVAWVGFQFWDIIMPLFMLLTGVSIPFALSKRLNEVESTAALWPRIAKRVALLWVFGLVVQGNLLSYDLEQLVLFNNTLQAIAIGYLIAVIFVVYLNVRAQLVATALLAASYWWVLEFLPVPGFGAGDYSPEGNAAFFIEQQVMGGFIEEGSDYTWVLSSLNFGVTVMLGVFAGYVLKASIASLSKLAFLSAAGLTLVVAGLAWAPFHPIIKKIWTGSFTLFSGGLCFLLLAAFFLLVDLWKMPSGFFAIMGVNAIVAYVAWHVFDFKAFGDVFARGLEPYAGDWYPFVRYTAAFLVIFMVLRFMRKKGIYVKV